MNDYIPLTERGGYIMENQTKPILFLDHHDPVLRKTATCDNNCGYTYWHIDRLAMEEPAECAFCWREVDHGWACLDGGEVYCDDCVVLADDLEFDGRVLQTLDAAVAQTGLCTSHKGYVDPVDALKAVSQWLRRYEIKVHNVRTYVETITGVK